MKDNLKTCSRIFLHCTLVTVKPTLNTYTHQLLALNKEEEIVSEWRKYFSSDTKQTNISRERKQLSAWNTHSSWETINYTRAERDKNCVVQINGRGWPSCAISGNGFRAGARHNFSDDMSAKTLLPLAIYWLYIFPTKVATQRVNHSTSYCFDVPKLAQCLLKSLSRR